MKSKSLIWTTGSGLCKLATRRNILLAKMLEGILSLNSRYTYKESSVGSIFDEINNNTEVGLGCKLLLNVEKSRGFWC